MQTPAPPTGPEPPGAETTAKTTTEPRPAAEPQADAAEPPTAAAEPPTAAADSATQPPTTEPPTAAAEPAIDPAASAPVRAGRRPRDMVRAMLVLMVPVILIVGLYRFLGHEEPPTVDTADVYDAARAAHAFDVLAPTGLSDEWHITSATFVDGTLRLGIVSPGDGQLRVVETGGAAKSSPTLIPDELGAGARVDGSREVAGTTWQRYVLERQGNTALVLADPARTIIVVGHASERDVQTLAASLK
jgi:hypothetical protein